MLTVHSIRYLFNGQECVLCLVTCIHIWILLPLIVSYVVIQLRVTWNFTDCLNWTANVNTTFKCSYHHNTLTQSLYPFQIKDKHSTSTNFQFKCAVFRIYWQYEFEIRIKLFCFFKKKRKFINLFFYHYFIFII